MKTLQDLLAKRILILDGAMGTMIQHYHLEENDYRGSRFVDLPGQQKGNNDLLSITKPEIIAAIHRKYLEAGADIIETNTFSAQSISMADYHCTDVCDEINMASAKIARTLADEYTAKNPNKPRFVAGSIGPTNKTCSMSPDVNDPAHRALTFDKLAEAYKQQMIVLIKNKVDALLIETIFDTLNAKAAICAAQAAIKETQRNVPIMLSVTISDKAGRTLSGQTIGAFIASVMDAPILSVGLNCSFGAADMKPFLEDLANKAPFFISAYPNAGLPNSMGEYDQSPEQMEYEIKEFVHSGLVNIIGGCCGTTDKYIARYSNIIVDKNGNYLQPHIPAAKPEALWISGLELLEVKRTNNFINIGERCNVAGSRKFLRLIKEQNYDEALNIARKQVEDGAQVIDINMDDGLLDTKAEMTHFLNLLAAEPDIAKVPVMIDSSKWDVISAALKCVQGKCIVNSISLKEGEDVFLNHARELKRIGAAAVVMAFDEKGQADNYERRIEICSRAYDLLTKELQFNPYDIIFDPNVLAICTGMNEHNNYALDFINATGWIRTNLKGAHVSGGVSNLSFSFRGNNYIREAMHAVFLYHAISKGMDMGIVNPSTSVIYSEIPKPQLEILEDVIFNRNNNAAEKLLELADSLKVEKNNGKDSAKVIVDAWRNETVEKRLCHALMKGFDQYLDVDINEALSKYSHAVDIIEGPLMNGMNQVGELFGEGKMFLPQVVKTARTMKKAVAILQPFIEKEKAAGSSAGKALLATVKGDVHDIGKNIVSVVLACNNYDITDLGVMCPAEKIVTAAIETNADFVGLSGLITPSLDEMINTAKAMKAAGLTIPILLGGATTSKLHTALKIAPEYDGMVVWVKDASQIVIVANQLLNSKTKDCYIENIKNEYKELRNCHNSQQKPTTTLEQARNNKLQLF